MTTKNNSKAIADKLRKLLEDNPHSMGAFVRAHRTKKGLTIGALSEITGLSYNHIWKIENDLYYTFSFDTAISLADELGFTLEELEKEFLNNQSVKQKGES